MIGNLGEHVDERAGADRDGVDLQRGQCIEPQGRNGRRHAGSWPAGLVVDHDMLGRQHHRVDVLHAVREQNDMPRLGLVSLKRTQRLDRSLQTAAHRGEIGRYDILTVHIRNDGRRVVGQHRQALARDQGFIDHGAKIGHAEPIIRSTGLRPQLHKDCHRLPENVVAGGTR